jgi:hypothetical protein
VAVDRYCPHHGADLALGAAPQAAQGAGMVLAGVVARATRPAGRDRRPRCGGHRPPGAGNPPVPAALT